MTDSAKYWSLYIESNHSLLKHHVYYIEYYFPDNFIIIPMDRRPVTQQSEGRQYRTRILVFLSLRKLQCTASQTVQLSSGGRRTDVHVEGEVDEVSEEGED